MIVGDAWVEWSAPGADDHQLIPSARFESTICFSLISAHLAKISKLVTIVGDARFNGIIRSSPQALVHYQLIPSLQSRRRPETSLQQLSDYSLGTRKDAELSELDLDRSRWDEAIGDTLRPISVVVFEEWRLEAKHLMCQCCLLRRSCPAYAGVPCNSLLQRDSADVRQYRYLLTSRSHPLLYRNLARLVESTFAVPQCHAGTTDGNTWTSLLADTTKSCFSTSFLLSCQQERSQPDTRSTNIMTRSTWQAIARSDCESKPHLACFHDNSKQKFQPRQT